MTDHSRVDKFVQSLTTDGISGPKTRFKFLESFARQLESELPSADGSTATAPRWVHCSERLPTKGGKYIVIVYDQKSDGKVLDALPFRESGQFLLPNPDALVTYWLEGLSLPPFYHQASHALGN